MISKFKTIRLASVLCVLVLVGCDKGRCVRNSDCNHLLTCVRGYCVIKPLKDSGVSSVKDAATDRAKVSQGDAKQTEPDVIQPSSQPSGSEEQDFFDLDSSQ